MKNLVLQIKELKVHFNTDDGPIKAVDGISFDVKKNSVVAIVGESGCGKSVTARTILQLLPPNAQITNGELNFFPNVNKNQDEIFRN